MSLQSITQLNIDFYNKKYITINAKQHDKNSRFILVTCYNRGELFPINAGEHAAYIRYRKSDEHSVFNFCEINHKGQILVELTEQMLACDGICFADLVIVNKGDANVDVETGEIVAIDNASILSTMTFCIDVSETAVENSEIESTYEFNLLNSGLETYWADFEDVMKTSKSYAIGNSGIRDGEEVDNSKYYSQLSKSYAIGYTEDNIRENEDVDNSKYYSEQSSNSANYSESYAVGGTGTRDGEDIDNAEYYSQMSKSFAMGGTGIKARNGEDTDNAEYYSRLAKSYTMGSFDGSTATRDDESTENAKTYMETAKSYMDTTEDYMTTAEGYMNTTEGHMTTAEGYMSTTEGYMSTTEDYMGNAELYMNTANEHMGTTSDYMNTAKSYMDNAKLSEDRALASEKLAQSYAIGDSGVRENEAITNAKYYWEQVKNILDGLNSGFIPMGTISFSELATADKATGYVYNINENFITDDTFREGAGMSYTVGTNVYYTGDGLWDCFGGSASVTATVDEVKSYLNI